ncbi:MAG: hypothetical protein WD738_22215 [Pirellulales bacterium]
MSHNRNDKRNIRYRQFEGGYAQALDTQLRAVLEGYRQGHFGRNEVRVFAGRLEQEALHEKSSVSLNRIINCQSQRKGNRRLSEGEIQTTVEKLDQLLPTLQAECEAEWRREERKPQVKPVARKVLRHIARGSATTVEALFCLAYFLRRIPQRKTMQRLKPDEYYARLRYAEFEAWTGVHRATQSRILQRLIDRGYLNTAPVHKQNENSYGQLFIDGPMLSLVRPRQVTRRRPAADQQRRGNSPGYEKKSTPLQDLVNTPTEKKSTLRNLNPKTEIQEEERLVLELNNGCLGRHHDPELQRIAARAAQMVENAIRQAA